MKKIILLSNVFVALVVLAFALPWHARAQVATTTISVGVSQLNLKADAGKFLAVPPCSIAAKCMAQLELCNTVNGVADSTHCIFIPASGQSPFSTSLWVGVSETTPVAATTTTAAGVSTTPYGFGTLVIGVPNNELNIVP